VKLLTSALIVTSTVIAISGCGKQPDAPSPSPSAAASTPASVPSPTSTGKALSTSPATPTAPVAATPRYDPQATSGACVLTRDEVGSVLGSLVPAPAPRRESTVSTCMYTAGTTSASSPATPFLSLEFTIAPESLSAFVNRQADSGGTRVQGIGDAAFFIRPVGASSRELTAHTGTTSILLELQLPGRDDGALLSALQGLATTVIARIPTA
jgi:hypothetical protein